MWDREYERVRGRQTVFCHHVVEGRHREPSDTVLWEVERESLFHSVRGETETLSGACCRGWRHAQGASVGQKWVTVHCTSHQTRQAPLRPQHACMQYGASRLSGDCARQTVATIATVGSGTVVVVVTVPARHRHCHGWPPAGHGAVWLAIDLRPLLSHRPFRAVFLSPLPPPPPSACLPLSLSSPPPRPLKSLSLRNKISAALFSLIDWA